MKIKITEPLIIEIANLADLYNYEIYIVGGYVRDYFLGLFRNDFDFTVVGDALEFANLVAEHFKSKAVLFKNFGTAMVPVHGFKIEFVGTRKEEYLPNSRKPIVTTGTLEDDLRRRDFTINAIAVSLNSDSFGEVIDLFDGQEDIKNKIIRTPLDTEITFNDDPLRMLRAARFAAKLGFDVVSEIITASQKLAERLYIVSMERISDELLKILALPKPGTGLLLLSDMGIMDVILPELTYLKAVEQVEVDGAKFRHKNNFRHSIRVLDNIAKKTDNIWLRLAALLHDIGKAETKKFVEGKGWTFYHHFSFGAAMLPEIFKRLKLPLHHLNYVSKLIELHHRPVELSKENITDTACRRLIVDAGEVLEDLFTLCVADLTSEDDSYNIRYAADYKELYQKLNNIIERDNLNKFQSPVSGDEIIELCNIPPSKFVGTIKNRIEEAIIVGIIPNEYTAARNYILENRENWLEEMELIPDSANDESKILKSNNNEIKLKPKVESINDIFELETKEDILIIRWIKQGISVLLVVINDSKNLKIKNTGNFTYSSIVKRLKEENWEIEPNQKLYIFYKQKLVFIAQIDSENQIIFGKEFKGYSENDVLFYSHTKGEYKGLSNFYSSEIEIDNRKYQTVEHFYQACKATNEKDFDEIANSGDPYSSKELGNSLPNRSDWDEIKYEVMMKGLYAKYTQHNDLKELLLSTGDSPIHEHTFNDRYWGYFDGLGRDMLGKALIETREKLKKNIIKSNQ